MNRATQQCNMSPYVYAVYWLPPASSAFLLARKCNWLAEKMLITCVMRHARLQKLQRFRRKMPFYSFLILWLVSVAYRAVLVPVCMMSGRSLINMMNKIGPRILPWGTPDVTEDQSEAQQLSYRLNNQRTNRKQIPSRHSNGTSPIKCYGQQSHRVLTYRVLS